MMRALAIAAIVCLVAACAPEEDLCAGKPGVCISLRIDSAVTLDEIAIRADDRGERRTPKPPSVLTLPVRFAVILSGARSQRDFVHLDVDGLLGGEVRARSSADVHLDRTGRGEASPRLLPVGDGERDLAVAPVDADGRDLAPVDFAVAADLARASDLARVDLGAVSRFEVLSFGLNGGSGTVEVSPPAPSCGTDCWLVPIGSDVTLTAIPAAGSRFVGFGQPCARGSTCTLRVSSHVDGVTASFVSETAIPNIAFVTRQRFSLAELGAGAANADALCRTAAQNAGLDEPQSFIALIAKTQSVSQMLAGARGWMRVDGLPVVDDIAGALPAGVLYGPVIAEDNSFWAPGVSTGFTASGSIGSTCAGWTSTTAMQTLGFAGSSVQTWLDRGMLAGCNGMTSLYCFQKKTNVPLVSTVLRRTIRRAFISTGTFVGGEGLADADALCTSEARAAGFSTSFRAYLNLRNQDGIARFDITRGPWAQVAGGLLSPIASLDSRPLLKMERTAAGSFSPKVTLWYGTKQTSCCSNWTSLVDTGAMLDPTTSVLYWKPCDLEAHLYCLEE